MAARKQASKGAWTRPTCKRAGCAKPAKAAQVYCSRRCSPFGNLPETRWGFAGKKLGSCGCFHLDPGACSAIQELRPLKLAMVSDVCPCKICHKEAPDVPEKKA